MANRYWVGGTASWDGTAGTKWSDTSGGAGGSTVPTTADDVFFDANSTGTVTIATGNTGAKTIACTGFTGTLTGTGALTVAGSITLVAGMTYSYTGTLTLTGTCTLTSAGKTFGAITINGSGITVTLGDALTMGGLTITAGSFSTSASNYSFTASALASLVTNTRSITFGSSTVTFSSNNPFGVNSTNLTFDAGTSQINFTNTGAANTNITNAGGLTFYNVAFPNVYANYPISWTGASTFNNLAITVSATNGTGVTAIFFSADQTINGTFSFSGSSVFKRGFVVSNTVGTARTLTVNTLTADDCDFRNITIAGAAAGTAPTRAGNCNGNSGITFPAAKTVYRVGTNTTWAGSSSWATSSGGTGADNNFPLAQDTAVIDESTALTGTLTGPSGYNTGSLSCSSRTTGITLSYVNPTTVSTNWYGAHTLGSGVTVSGTATQTFFTPSAGGTLDFTSAGKTITFAISVQGSFRLLDALTQSAALTLDATANFNANNYNLTTVSVASTGATTRTITMGSGLWTLSGTGTVWNIASSNLTFNKDTADILLSDTSTLSRTFSGGALTYNKLTIGGTTGTSTTTIGGINTFSELASTKTVAHTITFGAGQTVTTWSITGTAGNIVTINSSASGTARTLTKAGGGYLTGIDYLDVRSIAGSPSSDTWYIGANSVINTTSPNLSSGLFTTQRATNAVVVLTSTTSASWTVPSDWDSAANTIHLIGGGGGGAAGIGSTNNRAGGGGGGGGGYTKLTNQTLTPGASISYQAGASGAGSSIGNGSAGSTTSWNSGASTAGGGSGGQVSATPTSAGGAGGVGSTYNGGDGGAGATSTTASTGNGGGGGGGAGGPNGNGGAGGNGFSSATAANIAGGGGGGNGGGTSGGNASSATGGAGGNNSLGAGGGASNVNGVVGGGGGGSVSLQSIGGSGIDIFGVGSGGGGGGEDDTAITNIGGNYGGGGGGGGSLTTGGGLSGSDGAQGVIVVTYTPSTAPPSATGNFLMMFC